MSDFLLSIKGVSIGETTDAAKAIPKQPEVTTSTDMSPPSEMAGGISDIVRAVLKELGYGEQGIGAGVQGQGGFQDPDEPVSTTGTILDAAPMPKDSYVIKSGDTLSKIAADNPFTLTQLIASNPQIEDPNKIEVGQQLNFPPVGVAKAGQIPASTGTQQSVVSTTKILDDWGKLYQTENDPTKNTRAANAIAKTYTVPKEAQNSIEVAATVFEGDKGFSKESLIEYGKAIGQIESSYTTKVQRGGGPARSYWQVEPKTALDLLNNSSRIFGKDFEKALSKYSTVGKLPTPDKGKTAVQYLKNLSEKEMSNLLEKDSDLSAIMALAVIVNRT